MATHLSLDFVERAREAGVELTRRSLGTLQINLGKLCNQACLHCHVEAGPKRTEIMTEATADRVLELLGVSRSIQVLDLTGGAPELNPNFRRFVSAGRELGLKVMDRCNLTVLFEPGQEETPRFLRDHEVEVVASLPCYTSENVEKQRGNGVFEKSIRALRLLNDFGYGRDPRLVLNLVYNPLGAYLPPDQSELEADYRERLEEDFGVRFNRLFTLTNMPIRRFRHALERDGALQGYMKLLADHFNPRAAAGVMCRDLISVSWDGKLYDCDFNQMLEMPVSGSARTLWDVKRFDELLGAPIRTASHCFGCTAGAGSSCTGSLDSGSREREK